MGQNPVLLAVPGRQTLCSIKGHVGGSPPPVKEGVGRGTPPFFTSGANMEDFWSSAKWQDENFASQNRPKMAFWTFGGGEIVKISKKIGAKHERKKLTFLGKIVGTPPPGVGLGQPAMWRKGVQTSPPPVQGRDTFPPKPSHPHFLEPQGLVISDNSPNNNWLRFFFGFDLFSFLASNRGVSECLPGGTLWGWGED